MYYISYIILFVPVFGNFEVQKLLYIIYCIVQTDCFIP